MKLLKFILFPLMLSLPIACTSVLVQTVGDEGIEEDPTRRTAGARLEDSSIRTKIIVNLKSQEPEYRKTRFDVVSHNGVVLIVGQVPNDNLKARATQIASEASDKIKRIHNELEGAEKPTLLDISSDAWISAKVKTQMIADDGVPAGRVKVVTEKGCVYLMGLVNQAQGDNAAALARNVSGVNRVVKVFEYVN
jgi:osmotically-inducible protein OsmY